VSFGCRDTLNFLSLPHFFGVLIIGLSIIMYLCRKFDAMQIIETKGNRNLLMREKTLFLCSKRTPVGLYEYVFQWTDCLSEKNCIACFNSTDMESEVLKALLVAKIPTILFVMNRFTDVNNIQIERALQENRMLIVVLKRDEPKGRGTTPRLRNEYVLSLCQHVTCGYINKNGIVFSLLAGRRDVKYLIDEEVYLTAAEPDVCRERWTVAQDKVLLRMYYADMGIHAIHKKLQRSYTAVYARIHSITQPEEFLKGREFEDYVLSLFNLQEGGPLVLQEWQGDKSLGMIMPKNNSNPDFVFRYEDKEFAVECKWREALDIDLSKDLFPAKRIENYKRFAADRKMPVTVILGVGGESCNPELLYVIPLECLSAILSQSQSIMDFLCTSLTFNVFQFMRITAKTYTMEEIRRQYPNAYKPWCKGDDQKLLNLYREGKSVTELSLIFKRKSSSITSRIKRLIS